MARTSTYLNFTDHTEEAFLFYRTVFGTEFHGPIMRLGDAPMPEGAPQLSEADKKLVMHVELPITGGHMLMGTDAPASMGFTLTSGTNMHINLEPDTIEEGQRLFDALSNEGKVTEPFQPMFWGAWYGGLTDKYGIKWMVHVRTA
jgi:PhnB protein